MIYETLYAIRICYIYIHIAVRYYYKCIAYYLSTQHMKRQRISKSMVLEDTTYVCKMCVFHHCSNRRGIV